MHTEAIRSAAAGRKDLLNAFAAGMPISASTPTWKDQLEFQFTLLFEPGPQAHFDRSRRALRFSDPAQSKSPASRRWLIKKH
jgi:hypothetical protein